MPKAWVFHEVFLLISLPSLGTVYAHVCFAFQHAAYLMSFILLIVSDSGNNDLKMVSPEVNCPWLHDIGVWKFLMPQ